MKIAQGSLWRVRLSVVVAGFLALVAVAVPSSAAHAAVGGAQSGPVEPGVPYYLVATKLDRGITAGRASEYGDLVHFTDRAGDQGTPVVFEKDPNTTWGEGYQIRLQRRGSATMLCHTYNRWIALMDSCRQNPWMLEPSGDTFRLKTRWDGSYLYLAASPAFPSDKTLYWQDRYASGDLKVMEFKLVKAPR
ncbi:hypothetical protein ABZ543_33760 [Streptomyces roseifaciens]